LESPDGQGRTPYLCAIANGNLQFARCLQGLGANIHAVDAVGGNALWVMVNSPVGCEFPEVARYLLEQGVDMYQRVQKYDTPESRLNKYIETVHGEKRPYLAIASIFQEFGASANEGKQTETNNQLLRSN